MDGVNASAFGEVYRYLSAYKDIEAELNGVDASNAKREALMEANSQTP
jgi:hypothetical protein